MSVLQRMCVVVARRPRPTSKQQSIMRKTAAIQRVVLEYLRCPLIGLGLLDLDWISGALPGIARLKHFGVQTIIID